MQLSRNKVSVDQPYAVVHEPEPDGRGGIVDTTTVFLTASECPIGCNMCDLWQNTLPHPTPSGAITAQLDVAMNDPETTQSSWIKLYNSGNFFDAQSIPVADYPSIAQVCNRFERVVVENHPAIGASRLQNFQDLLETQLEVAVGLETVQPRCLDRLRKRMSRDDFTRYAFMLNDRQIDLRVFLIVGMPGQSVAEAFRWTRLSVRHAVMCGARHISLIPPRVGNGWNGMSDALPRPSVAQLLEIQLAAQQDAAGWAAVTVDAWDVPSDQPQLGLLQRRNLNQSASVVPSRIMR